ncbi:glycoside hydrolase [Polaromonas sp. P1(28)-13]|nr:glycoside hydrolase [Polaromonas sp. P1(28)-13]
MITQTLPHSVQQNDPGTLHGPEAEIHVYAGTAGHSAWFSDDLGQTWVHPNSHSGMYLEARVWSMSSHPATPESLHAGSDEGVFTWNEHTARWQKLSVALGDVWSIVHAPDNSATLYAGTRPATLHRSTDGGATWQELATPGIAKFSDVNMGPTRVTQLLFDPFTAGRLWATVEIGGIYRSDDAGATWRLLVNGLVSTDVHGIAVTRTPAGATRILASTNRGLHTSVDHGETWAFLELDSPWQYTRAVVTRADNPSIVFLANGNGPRATTAACSAARMAAGLGKSLTCPVR